jgi:LysM domain
MSIRMDQPQSFDLIGSPLMIAGIGSGFEATINYRVHDGHDGGHGFHHRRRRPGRARAVSSQGEGRRRRVPADRLFVEVFEIDVSDGSERHKVSRPVLLGTRMVKGSYIGYREHVVKRGDTLSKIAQDNLGSADVERLVRANAHVINDPNLIFPGQLIRIPIGSEDG